MSDTDTDDDNDHEDGSIAAYHTKPYLDPQAVKSLAASVPNCTLISNADLYEQSESNSYFSSETGSSYFSSFSRRLQQQTFSSEEKHGQQHININNDVLGVNAVLSFLVSDAYSTEQLAAEAHGKHGSTSELEGAGIARVDVYCQSGTVMTCRVIQTADACDVEDPAGASDANDSSNRSNGSIDPRSHGLSFMPLKGNRTGEQSSSTDASMNENQSNIQVRRIIRRKCNLNTLRGILERPPKLPEINVSIMDYQNNPISYDSDASNSSTVSKKLRKRQQRRQRQIQGNKAKDKKKKKGGTLSPFESALSKDQQNFLMQQQIRYEKRMLHDERVRQHVGNAILAAGMDGCEDIMDLPPSMKSMSLDGESTNNNVIEGRSSSFVAPSESTVSASSTISHSPRSEAYRAQKDIQEKIEIADMGLAILMGEAQRLEKMMDAIRKERGQVSDGDGNGNESVSKLSKKSGYDTDGSFSTLQSTNRDEGDSDVDDDSCSSASTLDSQQQMAQLARIRQGCDVEYSFPQEFHDELESALMGEDDDDDSSSSDDDDDSEDESLTLSKGHAVRRGRGRSPAKLDGRSSTSGGEQQHQRKDSNEEEVSPIIAIPTNGEGCIVLRDNGTFDVIGKIPDMLQKKLFRKNGPLPDQIALGTLGRYYVHFADGSYHFYGPPSLSKVLEKCSKKQKKQQQRKRGGDTRDMISIVSVAFGKELDDFFVVHSDGSWNAHGDNLPSGLGDLMHDRRGKGDLVWVALGANSEWCVRAMNGGVWWGDVSDEADGALKYVLNEYESDLKFIDFGNDDAYFLLHK